VFTDLRTSGYGRLALPCGPLTRCIISGLFLHHLRHYRHTFPIFIWLGEDYDMHEMLFALTTNQTTGGPAVMVWGWVVVGKISCRVPHGAISKDPSLLHFDGWVGNGW